MVYFIIETRVTLIIPLSNFEFMKRIRFCEGDILQYDDAIFVFLL